jgi:endonuclease/exonuclease/phosphatase family metal-dependent hydrolase
VEVSRRKPSGNNQIEVNMKTGKNRHILFAILITGIIFSCNKRVNNEITPAERINIPEFGTNSTLEIATWNIQQFPKSNNQTINDVVEIIKDLNIDLIAVQEVTSSSAFDSVRKRLNGFDGYLTNFSSLKTGIIYNQSNITVISDTLLFENDSNSFPRPPLMLYLLAQQGGQLFDFYFIVIHLKAFGDQQSVDRRKSAIQKMEQFINTRLQQGGDPDYIIAGDWNDLLEDDSTQNVFNPFLNNPQQYVFLTLPFAGSPTEYSYIGGSFDSLIDHIMVTASIDSAYNIETEIIKVDQFFNQYQSEVSDHRPVAARIYAF